MRVKNQNTLSNFTRDMTYFILKDIDCLKAKKKNGKKYTIQVATAMA